MEISLSEFKLIKEIGRGAFGVVHLAERKAELFAIKSLKIGSDLPEGALVEIKHEIKIMLNLRHPNIVTLIAFSMEEQPQRYMAMEYMEGGNLRSLLSSNKPIPPPIQHQFALDIALGLNYLHTLPKPVFHRDMKANNVLIDKHGTLKVADFGLSTVSTYSSAGIGIQPINWCAPELARRQKFRAPCDVYSFGMTLFEILSRKEIPFQALDAQSIFFALMNDERPEIPPNSPADLVALMVECWQTEPSARPTFEMIVQHLLSSTQQESNPTGEDLQQQIEDFQLAKQLSETDQQAMMFSKAALDLEKGKDLMQLSSILIQSKIIIKGFVSAQVLLKSDVLKQVVSCLNNQSTSPSVLEAATELVAALFTHDAVKKAVANRPRPMVDALFTCLRNNSNVSVVQQHIFRAIGNLTDLQDASQNWLVSDYDAINIVVYVLKQSLSLADLQAQAYYALQKIARGNEANIRFLFNIHRVHELALASMTNHATHIPLQTQGCALLRRLSFIDETKSVLMTTATATVIRLMRSFAAEPQIQEQGSAALANLALDANNKKLLVREPHLAHQIILATMRNHPQNAAIQEQGCGALRNLAKDADNKKLLVGEPHLAHQVILSAMRNHPQIAAVQESGCAALGNLAAGNDDNKKLLVREPHLAHQVILFAMRNHPQIAAVQEEGCAALWSLAIDANNQKLLVREPHVAHQVILFAMRNHLQIAAIQEQGCGALLNLAANNDNTKLLFQNDAHTTVIAALHKHPQQEGVQLNAVWVLSNLSSEVWNRAVLKQVGALPLCEKAKRNFPKNKDLAAKLATLKKNLA